jgi:hypothetical protein
LNLTPPRKSRGLLRLNAVNGLLNPHNSGLFIVNGDISTNGGGVGNTIGDGSTPLPVPPESRNLALEHHQSGDSVLLTPSSVFFLSSTPGFVRPQFSPVFV